ncbi:PQ loop repeat-domain-containing protein [Mycena crocata]|nr:PQ loop repeat-domain-containing protein [Mycena crocata]
MLAENGDFSSMLGWISIACWIVVYSPQIYENYALQSGEGLSVIFVVIWLLGDITNLVGAALAHLLPTVILIALYYSLCDITLVVQIYYYRWKRGPSAQIPQEETPLLSENNENSQRKVSAVAVILKYTAALIFVFCTGILAWWISSNTEKTEEPRKKPTVAVQWTIQILGWTSAVLYLGSRIPQIAKNFHTRCEGLSPALFFFAIIGNLTYSWSIIAKSTDRDYLITNAPWLAGSALTVFFDLIVLGQFLWYRARYVRQDTGTS